jgi:hypothetical protein
VDHGEEGEVVCEKEILKGSFVLYGEKGGAGK